MPYKMIIHSAGGPTGHFAVEILDVGNEGYVKGFYPFREDRIKSASTLPVEGQVKDDTDRIDEGIRNGSILSSKEIPLSKEEFDRVKGYFDQAKHNPGQYDLNDRNCVDFANGALRAAGVGKDLGNVLSQEQKAQMSGASVYRGWKYPKHDGLKFDMPPKPEKSQPETYPFSVPLPPTPGDSQMQPLPAPAPGPSLLPSPKQEQDGGGIDWAGLGSKALEIAQEIVGIKSAGAAELPPHHGKPADPRAAALVEMASAPVANKGQSALLKPVKTLTQGEVKDMIGSALGDYRGWRSGDPLKAHTYEKVQDWYVKVYGDAPQMYDGGKPIEPLPILAIPEQPSPHTTPQGEDLWQATGRIGRKVADAGASDGLDEAVKGLQRGLNILGEANPLPARSSAYGPYTKLGPVAEDGKYGPRTDFALKHATARLGPGKVEEAFALGRFDTFVRQAQRTGNVDGVEQKTHSIFGPLFRKPGDDQAPKVEGGVFQEVLNGIGNGRYDDWQPLKIDNWIGPKTTAAFGRILRDEDADNITSTFGKGLGLL